MVHSDFYLVDPRLSTPEGVVLVGGDLSPESLIYAYRHGIFPWPIPHLPMTWFCPPKRGILKWEKLHLSRSLKRLKNKNRFRFTIDQSFEEVIQECALIPRPSQDGTWITAEIQEAYLRLHHLKHAHSVEVWRDSELVGGLYGMDCGGVFSAESMFHKETGASKLAIVYLMNYLHSRGVDWLDIQVITPHLEKMGADVISREDFLLRLEKALTFNSRLF